MSQTQSKINRRNFLKLSAVLLANCAGIPTKSTGSGKTFFETYSILRSTITSETIDKVKANFAQHPIQHTKEMAIIHMHEFAQKNFAIAKELGAIPRFAISLDKLTIDHVTELEKFGKFYNSNSLDAYLNEMINHGKKRDYSAPFEAAVWAVTDDKVPQLTELAQRYYHEKDVPFTKYNSWADTHLKRILNLGWNLDKGYKGKFLTLNENERTVLMKGLENSSKIFLNNEMSSQLFNKTILWHFIENPRLFPKGMKALVKSAMSRHLQNIRLGDYKQFMRRMHTPEVADTWINSQMIYTENLIYRKSTNEVFKYHLADCDEIAWLMRKLLRPRGYKTEGRRVYGKINPKATQVPIGHNGEVLYDNGIYLIANYRLTGNSMQGPFKNILQADEALGYGRVWKNRERYYYT